MRVACCVVLLPLLACTATSPPPVPAPVAATPSPSSPTQQANDQVAKKILAGIAGHEKEPAGTVFKNIQLPWLKTVPAARFVSIMNYGYSKALGVTCTHCHLDDDFASDTKRPKLAAREMAEMHRMINDKLVAMQNLNHGTQDRFINCATCHRGHIDPNESNH
jgi:hypothetical protein